MPKIVTRNLGIRLIIYGFIIAMVYVVIEHDNSMERAWN